MPESERGKWRKAFTGDGRVSPMREGERYYEGKEFKGKNKRVA